MKISPELFMTAFIKGNCGSKVEIDAPDIRIIQKGKLDRLSPFRMTRQVDSFGVM